MTALSCNMHNPSSVHRKATDPHRVLEMPSTSTAGRVTRYYLWCGADNDVTSDYVMISFRLM